MLHFVRSKNLPYSVENIRQVINSCKVCAEVKPNFHQSDRPHLVKATQPFERLNIDFKKPLRSTDKNQYLLNIVDEYSRFPFVFPCSSMTASTVVNSLTFFHFWYTSIYSFRQWDGIHEQRTAGIPNK